MCHGPLDFKFGLEPTPIANLFPDTPDTGEKIPLDLMECRDCGHVQMRHVVTGLFDDYKYRTPKAFESHLKATAATLRKRYPFARSMLEIGSNNGMYTEILHAEGFKRTMQCDPAGTHWACWKVPFGLEIAKEMFQHQTHGFGAPCGHVDLIVANNVFAHIDDLDDVFRGIDYLLSDHGAVVIEVQDFQASLNTGMFDMVYHEHLDQHRPGPWAKFLKRFNLNLTAVEHIPVHGGSIRLTATRHGNTEWIDPPINWTDYRQKVSKIKSRVISRLKGEVVAWGATAKATTLIHQLGLEDRIRYIVDTTPEKHHKYLAGTSIKVVPDFLTTPDTVLLTAWNYADEFKKQYPALRGINPYG